MITYKDGTIDAMPRGVRNNNPLNLKFEKDNPWTGQVGEDADGFAVYSSPYYGIRAAALTMYHYIRNLNVDTVEGIIKRWVGDDPKQYQPYIATVCNILSWVPGSNVGDPFDIAHLLSAMSRDEDGKAYYTTEFFMAVVNNTLNYQED